jgi:hypothetical protein
MRDRRDRVTTEECRFCFEPIGKNTQVHAAISTGCTSMSRYFPATLLLALGFSWLMIGAAPVHAQASYYLAIAEDSDVAHMSYAASTGNADAISALKMAEKYAAWKTQPELFSFRDYPYFEITNTSVDPTAAITNFRIAIDPSRPFNFDTVFYVESSPGITYTINNLDTIQNGLRADYIDLSFTGFTADKFFRFRSDIDNDTGNVNFATDFRNVLTDAGDYDSSTNARVTVNMSTGVTFNDQIGANQLMGPYYTTSTMMREHDMDMVQPYTIGNTSVIPEPTSWLALGGLLAGVGIYSRNRRNTSPL